MMIHFSMSSLLMSVLFSNILLILLYVVFKNTNFLLDIGYQLLTIFLAATLLRFLFPFELFCSTNIYMPEGISQVIVYFKRHWFSVASLRFTLWHVFLILWLIGIIVGVYLLIRKNRRLSMSIRVLGTDISQQEPYASTLQRVCEEQNQPNHFRMMKMRSIDSPMVTGLLHPVILIPDTLTLEQEELYYILSHEAAHYFRHDLWLKLFSLILCILYWWNPFMYALRRQISAMLELRIDHHVTASIDPAERLQYMECLTHVAHPESQKRNANSLTISFSNSSEFLLQRFKLIGDSAKHKINRQKQIALSALIVILYVFSIFFIFEPDYTLPEVQENSYELTTDNSYLIINPEGGYDLYVDGQFINIVHEPLDNDLSNLKIYQSKEELP